MLPKSSDPSPGITLSLNVMSTAWICIVYIFSIQQREKKNMSQKHTQSLRVPLDAGCLPGCWYVLRYSRYTASRLQDKRSGDLERGVMTDPRDKAFKKEKRQ
jgi:hypothetical protein